MKFGLGALILGLAAGTAFAYDRPLVGPSLGAATDLGQTWSPRLLTAAAALPLSEFRDEIFWKNVEMEPGRFVFDTRLTTYPSLLPHSGARLLFLANNPNPAYEKGSTPATREGAQAFARYVAAVLTRFPDIDTVEVGNEMNSHTFAWGPGWDAPLDQRAASYAQLLAATAQAARAAHPGIQILGGAAHSIPIAWFKAIFAHGAAGSMDAVAIHPYTVRPEQFARQVDLLRQDVPELANLPIAVTEFGQKDTATAPAYLLKSYCQQAISGVTRSVWYPLNPRGDGLAALLDAHGGLTSVGQTFRFIRSTFEGKPAEDIAPDPFTFGCRFGETAMVLWGQPRDVALAPGVQALDLSGQPLTGGTIRLSAETPLILTSSAPLRLGQEVILGPGAVLADSWTQFAYPGQEGDPFEHLLRQNGQDTPLVMRPGQERDGVPWTPYLASDLDGFALATAEWVQPSNPPAGPIAVVTRYRVPTAESATVDLRLEPWDGGVALSVTLNGKVLRQVNVTTAQTVTLDHVALSEGDVLEAVAAPNQAAGGTGLRITLRRTQD